MYVRPLKSQSTFSLNIDARLNEISVGWGRRRSNVLFFVNEQNQFRRSTKNFRLRFPLVALTTSLGAAFETTRTMYASKQLAMTSSPCSSRDSTYVECSKINATLEEVNKKRWTRDQPSRWKNPVTVKINLTAATALKLFRGHPTDSFCGSGGC